VEGKLGISETNYPEALSLLRKKMPRLHETNQRFVRLDQSSLFYLEGWLAHGRSRQSLSDSTQNTFPHSLGFASFAVAGLTKDSPPTLRRR